MGKATILREWVKTKIALRNKKDEDILALPDMTDTAMIDVMDILGVAYHYVYLSRVEFVPIIAFRMIRLSLQHGWHDSTSFGFVLYSILLCTALGNCEEGNRFGQVALSLLSRSTTMRWHAKVYACYYVLSSHFSQPLRTGIDPLLNGYNIGMRAGGSMMRSSPLIVAPSFSSMAAPPWMRSTRAFGMFIVCSLTTVRTPRGDFNSFCGRWPSIFSVDRPTRYK